LQEQVPQDEASPIFGTVKERLRDADQGLTEAESRARGGGDAPSGALATSIAAVRLQVTDLLDYVGLLEWASAFCAIAADVRRAIPVLSSPQRDGGVSALERSAAQLSNLRPPTDANEVHASFSRALAAALSELRSDGDSGNATRDTVSRLRTTVNAAADGAPLRTRLALEQFRACESLLGS
jgi:hypothetical protein